MGWISVMGWFFGILAVCAFVSDEVLPRIAKARWEPGSVRQGESQD